MNVMDGDVSEDWLIGRRIPSFVCVVRCFCSSCCSRCSCTQNIYEERSDGTNKEEEEWGEKDHLFERVKPKNSKSPKSHKRDPLGRRKKKSTTVCSLNSYSSRRAGLAI